MVRLLDLFRQRVAEILAAHPALVHEWTAENELTFPRSHDQGFDVSILVEDDDVSVAALGFHEHFGAAAGPPVAAPTEMVETVLGYVRDLLSPGIRIREKRAGRTPYSWTVEVQEGSNWVRESKTAVPFFNYLGRRSERVYQNQQLPNRLGEAS